MENLGAVWIDDAMRAWLIDRATSRDDRVEVRCAAVEALAEGWGDDAMGAWLADRAATEDLAGKLQHHATRAYPRHDLVGTHCLLGHHRHAARLPTVAVRDPMRPGGRAQNRVPDLPYRLVVVLLTLVRPRTGRTG